MKKPPPPPTNKPQTARRKQILENAMAQLKKTRAQMDPQILSKIRSIVASNPKIMKGLGITKMPAEPKTNYKQEERVVKPLTKQPIEPPVAKQPVANKPKPQSGNAEKIDQAKNMEVMAKLMELKPKEIENIKSVILKSQD